MGFLAFFISSGCITTGLGVVEMVALEGFLSDFFGFLVSFFMFLSAILITDFLFYIFVLPACKYNRVNLTPARNHC